MRAFTLPRPYSIVGCALMMRWVVVGDEGNECLWRHFISTPEIMSFLYNIVDGRAHNDDSLIMSHGEFGGVDIYFIA